MRTGWVSFAMLVGCLVSFGLAPRIAAGETTSITVKIAGVQQKKGDLKCRLFDEEGWLDEPLKEASTSIDAPEIRFEGLKAGRYAVACIHDHDGNDKLTFGLFWRPKEGSGFSRGYRPFGPPRFSKAAFEASGVTEVTVELEYP
jgi:uncharacterized protein (DUF2141 family)